MRVIKCQAEGGRLSQTKVRATDNIINYKSGTNYKIMPGYPYLILLQYRATEEGQYHVYELQIEAKDKPLSVIIDGDVASITENVIR